MNSKTTSMIGIMGTGAGTGTTHFGFMLSTFLSVVKGQKIAYVEKNNSDCFRQAEIILNKKLKRIISIYKHSDADLSEIMSSGYDYVIIDFGHDYGTYREQFLLCTRKIIVGSLSWWKIGQYANFAAITENEKSRKYWAFLVNTPVSQGVKYLKYKMKTKTYSIPYEPDPLCLSAESLDFLNDLVRRIF